MSEQKYFKALVRVVKSLTYIENQRSFPSETIVRELIRAVDKADVKAQLLLMHPQFFQNGKVYEKETKDTAQFFYVVIYPLWNHELDLIKEGEWTCSYCNQIHENKYVVRPKTKPNLFPEMMFCPSDDDHCLSEYKKAYYTNIDLPDDEIYVKKDSPNYIYKITEKSTNKCYVGKTRNAPFFRWWNHLAHSSSPFGIYLRTTKLSDWTFEVLDMLPAETKDTDVFALESKYIQQFDAIFNGYNSLISNKSAIHKHI